MEKKYALILIAVLVWGLMVIVVGGKHYEKMAEIEVQKLDVTYKQDQVSYAPEKAEKTSFWGRTR